MGTVVYVDNPSAMRFLIQWVAAISDSVHRALGEAMIDATEIAYADAIRRVKVQFNNTPGYVRSGFLGNSISRGFDKEKGKGFLQVDAPYGRLQEEGGTVVPKSARHLWVKNWVGIPNAIRRMTPREWMAAHAADPKTFRFGHAAALYQPPGDGRAVPMFYLKDSVTVPERPYLRPAVEAAYAQLPALLRARLIAARS